MPKPKWKLNTIYISERLQESLRPISRCATDHRGRPDGLRKDHRGELVSGGARKGRSRCTSSASACIPTILRSSGEARRTPLPAPGFDLLRDYACPTDAAGGGLLADDLCHELAGETPCYLFIDDFHLLTDATRRRLSLYACEPPARQRPPDRCQPRPLSARRERSCGWGRGCTGSARSSCG